MDDVGDAFREFFRHKGKSHQMWVEIRNWARPVEVSRWGEVERGGGQVVVVRGRWYLVHESAETPWEFERWEWSHSIVT